MPNSHFVVDGSNIATEGRTFPSLQQLESAIEELKAEHPKSEVTVVVDATFAHRIDPSELARFEEALARAEYIIPPAGAIGRGDAFVLKIAEKVNATVVSNDSFQEFHGEHAWLFDSDRLLGASPVPGVGWIFVPRTPVRGAKSRAATRGVRNLPPMPKPKIPPPGRSKRTEDVEEQEPAVALPAVASGRRRPSRRVATSVAAVNDPATFISFIASHPLGEIIEAEVESFTSHGAVIRFDGVHCYAPLSGLGDPPPRSPREVLTRGEVRGFQIRGLDPERRGVELALPEPQSADGALVTASSGLDEATPALISGDGTRTRQGKRSRIRTGSRASNSQVDAEDRPSKDASANSRVVATGIASSNATRPANEIASKVTAGKKQAAKKQAAKKQAAKKQAADREASPTGTHTKSATSKVAAGEKRATKRQTAKQEAVERPSKALVTARATAKIAPLKAAPAKKAPEKKAALKGLPPKKSSTTNAPGKRFGKRTTLRPSKQIASDLLEPDRRTTVSKAKAAPKKRPEGSAISSKKTATKQVLRPRSSGSRDRVPGEGRVDG